MTTFAIRQEGVYLRENLTAASVQIGVFDPDIPGTERKMLPVPDGFRIFGTDVLKKLENTDSPWITVDEIGYLERNCDAYMQQLLSLFQKKQVAACVRKEETDVLSEVLSDAFIVDLDDPFGKTGCVIMASGLGTRFGGNKLMADFHGEPMISACLTATENLPHRVVVTRSADVAAYCKARNVPAVLHREPYRSDTVRLGLEALGNIDRCMFCPADQPLLSRDTVNALALCGKNEADSIWRTKFEETEGAPVLFPKQLFPELLTLPEGKGGGYAAKKHPEQIKLLPVRDRYELMDADTREELEILLGQ